MVSAASFFSHLCLGSLARPVLPVPSCLCAGLYLCPILAVGGQAAGGATGAGDVLASAFILLSTPLGLEKLEVGPLSSRAG